MSAADDYVRQVNFWLSDLPWRTKKELLTELRGHLAELPEGTDLASLGTPEQYATDLRTAAGLERRRGVIAFLLARRPRNVILTMVTLTVIGVAIGAVAWIDSYQPLVFGDGYQFPAGAKGVVGTDGESVVFRKGRPFRLGVEIGNAGRFTVRVIGVPFLPALPWKAQLMMTRPNRNGGSAGPYERFRPFHLRPRQFVFLFLDGVYACKSGMSGGGGFGIGDFPVRYSFLWRTSTVEIPLPEELEIRMPNGCPTPASGATP